MKFDIDRDVLAAPLKQAVKLSTKNAVPILSAVLIETTDAGLRISATDMTAMYQITIIPNDIDEDGAAALPAKEFLQIVEAMPAGNLEITVTHGECTVQNGRSKLTYPTMNAEDFPDIAHADGSGITLSGKAIKRAIAQTAHAALKEKPGEISPLQGIYIEGHKEVVKFTAANRIRMAQTTEKIESDEYTGVRSVIPATAAKWLRSALTDEELTATFSPAWATFTQGNMICSARLLSDNYPNVLHVLAHKKIATVLTNKNSLLQSLERVSITATKQSESVIVRMDIGQEIRISGKSDAGTAEDFVAVHKFEGDELTLAANALFLIDALQAIDNELVDIKFCGEGKPIIITGADENDNVQGISPARKALIMR